MSINNHYRSECDFERDVIPDLKRIYSQNIWCYRTSYKQIQPVRGIPDWLFCFYGYFVAIEFKNGRTDRKPHETLQNYNLMKIREANGFSSVCRTRQEVFDTFARIHDVVKNK